jgi:transposase-like protein
MQDYLQVILEDEVTEFLGRAKSVRRAAVDAPAGYRNGHGKARRLALTCGTIAVQRPRLRGLEEQFESRVLPLFVRRTREVGALLPELYLHGLAQGDFELALRGLLGEGAPLSPASIARLRAKWQTAYDAWTQRSLAGQELVYLWADGLYVKAGLEKDKAALLVVIGAFADGHKEILAVTPGFRESTESWTAVLRSLNTRGLAAPQLVIADGHLGIWAALRGVWPRAAEQRCWNHKLVNVLDKFPKTRQADARAQLTAIPYAPSRAEAEQQRDAFAKRYRRWYPQAVAILEADWDRMVAFYAFPKAHWKHLRTTNVVESPFAAVRLRTTAAKRFKRVENATALIWRLLRVAESRFRLLNASELLPDVAKGKRCVDGEFIKELNRKVA